MANRTRLLRSKLLIILLVTTEKVSFGDSSSLVDVFQPVSRNSKAEEALVRVMKNAPRNPARAHVSSQAIYDAVQETMYLVQSLIDGMKEQGSQLDAIQRQLGQQNPGGTGYSDEFLFSVPFSSEILFPFFPGATGYFPQPKKNRPDGRTPIAEPNKRFDPLHVLYGPVETLDPRHRDPEVTSTIEAYLKKQGRHDVAYDPYSDRQLRTSGRYKSLDGTDDSRVNGRGFPDPQRPVPEDLRQQMHHSPYNPIPFYPQKRRSLPPPEPSPQPSPEPPSVSSRRPPLDRPPPDLSPYLRNSPFRSSMRQLNFGPPPNGPANDPDLSIFNSEHPSPEGVYPPSDGFSNQEYPPVPIS